MFGFLKKKSSKQEKTPETTDTLHERLAPSRKGLTQGLQAFFSGASIDDELLEEIETRLIMADVGIDTTTVIMKTLEETIARQGIDNAEALMLALHNILLSRFPQDAPDMDLSHTPSVILVIGVNGAGKTTTIGKLAKQLQSQGKSVMLAAGDTFRAAAVEQLQSWGQRNSIPVIAQKDSGDTASVVFDAVTSAKAKNVDVLIADTAGRLHTQQGLMDELSKVVRAIQKALPDAPHETLLVLDSTIGQNALAQAEHFNTAVPINGLVLTKLDGTAKGGVVIALADKLGLPVRYIGIGERTEDLREFDAAAFVDALLDKQ